MLAAWNLSDVDRIGKHHAVDRVIGKVYLQCPLLGKLRVADLGPEATEILFRRRPASLVHANGTDTATISKDRERRIGADQLLVDTIQRPCDKYFVLTCWKTVELPKRSNLCLQGLPIPCISNLLQLIAVIRCIWSRGDTPLTNDAMTRITVIDDASSV
jgi:hypothetical protein